MKRNTIVFVTAGMMSPKKWENPLSRQHLYLNYGALGLASVLEKKGYTTRLVDGRFKDPNLFSEELKRRNLIASAYPLFLSIVSYYAIPWAIKFCSSLKALFPSQKIVVGGRWVAGVNGQWLSEKIIDADLIVCGTAERRIESLINQDHWKYITQTNITPTRSPEDVLTEYPDLNYYLLDKFKQYNPSIEISRGCGMGCLFCVERKAQKTKMRSPESTVASIEKLCRIYDDKKLNIYFENSYFNPDISWIKSFKAIFQARGLTIKWRTETRCEGVSPLHMAELATAGLKIIDLGLESASPTQLKRMGKCRDPHSYLRKVSSLLKNCKDLGIWVKVNILLYPGESSTTIEESMHWLLLHKNCIKGVSVGPLVVFLDENSKDFLSKIAKYGARPVNDDSLLSNGYVNLHLSDEIDFDRSCYIARQISKEFMSDRDYYDLKSFSYFSRNLTFNTFKNIARSIPPENRPFKIDEEN